jgi:hypothetical protein
MHANRLVALIALWMMVFTVGCKKSAVNSLAFESALNSYYAGRQNCLWPAPVKFPAQADTSNDEQTKGYDALTDSGLLTRKAEEKKRFLIGSKAVNDYDLSDQGRSFWTADTTQPGYGNFCFGHPEVTSIDEYTPANDSQTQYNVTYHIGTGNVPAWANSAEVKTAFPKVATATAGQQTATATMVKTDSGWQVQNVQAGPPPANPMP